MEKYLLEVKDIDSGIRLDQFICSKVGNITRSFIQKLIDTGMVTVNNEKASKSYAVKSADNVNVIILDAKDVEVIPQNIPIEVLYEDDDLLVVNKPKNMVVHPAPGNYKDTLVNALLFHCKDSLSGINGILRPGIVHRIDKNTSGLLLVAKNDFSHNSLSGQIQLHSLRREYESIVTGNIKDDKGTINLPIGRHPIDRKKMAVTYKHSRNAVTHYEVLNRYQKFTHIKLRLETGRTHQIRVHMSYMGHPVAGDEVYGKSYGPSYLCGQCLHAKTLGFLHPRTNKYIEIVSELPDYFLKFIEELKNNFQYK